MIETDDIEHIDKSQFLPAGFPILTPERAAKGDVITGNDCDECSSTGKEKYTKLICKKCYGKGWHGEKNAMDVPVSDIRFAQVQVRNILNYLWGKDYITDENHDDGHTFEAWRNQHRVAMGQQKAVSGDNSQSTGIKLRAFGYVLLIRRLSVYDHKAIVKSIETFSTSNAQWMADQERKVYARAYACLTTAFKPIREQVAYLEGLADEERDELCADRLKSFLDRVRTNAL